jgi:diguanylate cyclase (GGDEF)-like protein
LPDLPLAAYSIIISGSGMIAIAMITTGNIMMLAMAGNIAVVSLMIVYMVSRQYAQLKRIVMSRSALNRQQKKTQRQAHQDQLTGLPNRRALLDALEKRVEDRQMSSVALALLDLNGFKPVNDTYGHATGDSLLAIIGKRLQETVNGGGLVARLGGDEFAILLEDGEDIAEIYMLVERARSEIAENIVINDCALSVSACFGLVISEQMPNDPLELIRRADIALYEAKRKNHGAISLYEQAMDDKVKRSTLIEQGLADPVMLAGIVLHYQPIFQTSGGRHVGFEALARWNHSELGPIEPREFIEAAERCGRIIGLTLHLFEKALETAKSWPDDIFLSFNLSASGLATSGLNRAIPDLLQKYGFDPYRLALEVTETALLRDKMGARNILESFQQMGIRIFLDDFGAGHASIGYLRNIHFDGIKLDGSLISDIIHNAKARDLLIGVLHLCKAVGASVTAEMIESEAQLALLRPLPIDCVQGYLLGGPVPADETLEPDSEKRANRARLLSAIS